jgi:hypothetical protein
VIPWSNPNKSVAEGLCFTNGNDMGTIILSRLLPFAFIAMNISRNCRHYNQISFDLIGSVMNSLVVVGFNFSLFRLT